MTICIWDVFYANIPEYLGAAYGIIAKYHNAYTTFRPPEI